MPRTLSGLIEIHIAVLLFSFAGLFGKLLSLSPVTIVFGRTLFAALSLGTILATKNYFRLSTKLDGILLMLQGILLAIHWLTFYYSIQISSVAVALIAASIFPIFVTFMEPLFFKEPLRIFDIVTAIIVLVGLVLVVPEFDFSNQITQGVCWGTLAGLTFGVLCLMNRKFATNYPSMQIAFSQNAIAAIVTLPFFVVDRQVPTLRELLLLGVLGICCTAIAHALFIRGLVSIKTQLASVITGLEPVYGIIFAILLLSEIPEPRTIAGGTFILGAIVTATLGRKKVDHTK